MKTMVHGSTGPRAMSRRTGTRRTALLTALAMTCAAGCGSTATITRVDGYIDEARIVRSDSGALYVQTDSSTGGTEIRLDRTIVRDIDHPGNAAMIVGGLFLGVLALMVSSRPFRDELLHGPAGDTSNGAGPLTLMVGTPGVGLLGYGLFRYMSSKRAASAFEHAPAAP
jgi:hypothetical protein